MSPEPDSPPQEGASREVTPQIEAETAADHLPETTGVEEDTQTINTITGTAAITKIRDLRRTKRGVTGPGKIEIGDMRETTSQKRDTDGLYEE